MHDEKTREQLLEEIQQLNEHVSKLEKTALHDPLTGLPNRIMLRDRFVVAQGHAKRNQDCIAVMMIDVDHFKAVNDTYGHQVGDEILKEVSKRLVNCLREYDTVARISGDEFVAMISCGDRDVKGVVERVSKKFKKKFSRKMNVTVSIGVALYPRDGLGLNDVLEKADEAMYESKKRGRNCYTIQDEERIC